MEAQRVSNPQLQVHARNFSFSQRFRNVTFPRNLTFSTTKAGKKFHLKATSNAHHHHHEDDRRLFLELPPSAWGDHFLSLPINHSEVDALAIEIDEIKPKVTDMLMSSQGDDAKKKICLIHTLIGLGLSYHFENEIEETLKNAFEKLNDLIADEDDLYTISVMFQVFRTYRHNISSDVFMRFKGDDGNFKKCLSMDVKGMLCLYEAANWGMTTEEIMDEALSFSLNHLESLAGRASPHISRLIKNALFLPQHQNTPLLFAREFITFYEQEQDHDKMLLKFAKLNFKFLQLHYIQELKTLAKWWKDLDLRSKLPHYFRDRLVECYFYTPMMYLEPQFAVGRIMLTKFLMILSIFDDTCDRYASVPEVANLVDSVNRWDIEAIDRLPGHLKIVFKLAFDIFEEFQRHMRSEGRSYAAQCTLEEFKSFARTNLTFVKWAQAAHLPEFEEYMTEVGEVQSCMCTILACGFMGMGQIAGEEAYEWLKSRPKLVQALSTKGRLMNDMTGFKDDTRRGNAINGINIYMKQYGVTEEEAIRRFGEMVRDTDKIMNEEFLKTSVVPRQILLRPIHCGQMDNVTYRFGDGYTDPQGIFSDHVASLLVDPIHL